ncbi:MAG: hypothetical protein GY771_12080 [bacterium]|nr:hypothetical protein [bacterium]
MPRFFAYAFLIAATLTSAAVINDAAIGVYTVQTELVLSLDKVAEFSLTADSENRLLRLDVSANVRKNVETPQGKGLISSIDIVPADETTCVAIHLGDKADKYRAYATKTPATITLQIFRTLEVKTPKPEGLDVLHSRLDGDKILLIDDDDGPNNGNKYGVNVNEYYEKSLDLLGISYDTAVVRSGAGGPSYSKIAAYPLVIWFTGLDARPVVFSGSDMANLKKYVADGGRAIIASQNLISDCGSAGRSFCTELVGAHSFKKDTQVSHLVGTSGGPFDYVEDLDLTNRLGPIGNWGDGFKCNAGTPFFEADDGLLYGAGGGYGVGKSVVYSFAPENLVFERKISIFLLETLLWLTEDMEVMDE